MLHASFSSQEPHIDHKRAIFDGSKKWLMLYEAHHQLQWCNHQASSGRISVLQSKQHLSVCKMLQASTSTSRHSKLSLIRPDPRILLTYSLEHLQSMPCSDEGDTKGLFCRYTSMQANQEADGFCQEVPHTTGVGLSHAQSDAQPQLLQQSVLLAQSTVCHRYPRLGC